MTQPVPPSAPEPSRPPVWLPVAPVVFLLLWSGGFSFAKLGILYAEPMTFLVLRYAVVLALLLPMLLALRVAMPARPRDWLHIAFVGVLIQAVYFGGSYIAFDLGISAGTSALIVSLYPILVALISPALTGERIGPARWGGLALGLSGAAIVILARAAVEPPPVWALVAQAVPLFAITWATLHEKRYGGTAHPVAASVIQYAAGFVAVLPFALVLETMAVDWTGELAVSLAYLVVGNSIIGMILLITMIRHGEASRVSALFFLIPPTASIMAWGLLGEVMPPLAWVGLGVAAVGVWLARR